MKEEIILWKRQLYWAARLWAQVLHDRGSWPVRSGLCAGKALRRWAVSPEAAGTITRTLLTGCAVAESTGIYSLLIALVLIFVNPLVGML